MATNAYADVANVILAGTLFMRPSFYTALTHLAQGKPTGCHMVADDAVQRTIQGEHANLLLQAICRGRVRKLDGDRCLPMSAYVIAAASHGLPGALRDIFPGCTVVPWQPNELKLKGTVKDAVAFVKATTGARGPTAACKGRCGCLGH